MKKFIASIVGIFLVIAGGLLGVGLGYKYERVDTIYMNEVLQSLTQDKKVSDIVYDYTWIDKQGNIRYTTKNVAKLSYETLINRAIGDGDVVVDFGEDKVIFYVGAEARFLGMRNLLLWLIVGAFVLLAIVMAIGSWLLYLRTIKPFNNLRSFAMEVAKGNLDSPLVLDKYMSFGAFGEAFDIMRNNLRESRLAEQNANSSRSRLLQDIGHEIKTPVSTIKAIAECGMAVSQNNDYKTIIDKANSIDNLVNDFYQRALEEEGQLNIYMTKHNATALSELICESDYNSRVNMGEIPDCEVLYDNNRMTQIIDNIIANSYKYADTEIKVNMEICEDKFITEIRDFGDGVAKEQLSYIMERFYRGEKTDEKLGQGLGLHICRRLIIRMGGSMECFNDNGFVVRLTLPVFRKPS